MPLEDILSEEEINEPFLAQYLYLIEHKNVTTPPALTAIPAANADYVTRTGTWTLVATKFFKKFQILTENGDAKGTDDGGVQMLGHAEEITVTVTGVDAPKIGWFKKNKLKQFYVGISDRSTLQLIMGDPIQGVFISKVERNHGKDRGFKVTFRYAGAEPTVWAGAFPLA